MKTNRRFIHLQQLLIAGFFFSGCYTQMESIGNEDSDRRNRERNEYAYNDSSSDQDSGSSVADNYFSDDGYRSMRYRMSFGYYYPSRQLWATSIWIDPWYDDFYAYPWDPWYRPGLWYPTIAYPYPYWYPGWGYGHHYGPGYGYGNLYGHNYPLYGSTIEPGRRRTTGSTRGDAGTRIRSGAMPPAGIPSSGSASPGGLRTRDVPGSASPATTEADRAARRRSREEVPWWERARSSQNSPDRVRTGDRSRVVDDKISATARQKAEQKTTKQNEQKQVRQQRNRSQQTPQARSADRAQRRSTPSVSPRSRQEAPRYSSPPRESGRSRSSGTGGSGAGVSKGGGDRGRREK